MCKLIEFSWAFFAILTALMYAISNMIDKFLLTNSVKPKTFLAVIGSVTIFAAIFTYSILGISEVTKLHAIGSIMVGILFAAAIWFYLKAVESEEISRIVPIYNLLPVFVLFLSAIFLGEIFTSSKYVGIFLLVIGAVLISVKGKLTVGFTKPFLAVLLSVVIAAVSSIIVKYLLNFMDYGTMFFYTRIGLFLFCLPAIIMESKNLFNLAKSRGKNSLVLLVSTDILGTLAGLSFFIAASLGPITLVTALGGIQPFFVLLFAILLSAFYPRILKEEIGKTTIALKLVAITLMFVGVLLVT